MDVHSPLQKLSADLSRFRQAIHPPAKQLFTRPYILNTINTTSYNTGAYQGNAHAL